MACSSADDIPNQLAALLGMPRVRIRKTDEAPPRVSVVDVAVAVTGHDANYASQAVRNICEQHPDVHEKIMDVKFPDVRGRRGQKNTPVADVKGIVEVILLLPGQQAKRVRRQAAELLVRYLGGDLGIIDEVIALRGLQEELAAGAREDPRRLFGDAVEAASATDRHPLDSKRLLEDVERVVRAAVQDEVQQHHVWSFSKRSRNHRELLEIGQVVQGSALRELDRAEHVIQIADFLKDRIAPLAWAQHGRKFKNIYSIELKCMKLRECREEGAPPPVTFNQGEHRIVYTEADMDLMIRVLEACRPRFELIATRDVLTRPRRGQRSIVEFMQSAAAQENEDAGRSEPE